MALTKLIQLPKIEIAYPDDDTLEVLFNGDVIGTITHDDAGWSGMEAAQNVVNSIIFHLKALAK